MIKSLLLSGVVSIAFSAPVFADTAPPAPAPHAPDKVAINKTDKAPAHKAPAKKAKAKAKPVSKATTAKPDDKPAPEKTK